MRYAIICRKIGRLRFSTQNEYNLIPANIERAIKGRYKNEFFWLKMHFVKKSQRNSYQLCINGEMKYERRIDRNK